ncbi:hypothetical protein EDB81DRAFT_902721 [Dactylonectria macrodidyma]|uniref:2EXR domain-containing protein n=1 Tax=Dactylonectria macrodidyma TaxID=307937 RepID=A0A9P9ECF0_9HYPO|nr:hypothetical protein EDB81DRAFT_902721 [Dactylonectria macrodidyma]
MSPSTFHRFGDLPAEIRLKIWEMAMRPKSDHGGVHYITLDYFNGAQTPDSTKTGSAYEWDYGLMTASQESRLEAEWHRKATKPRCQSSVMTVEEKGKKHKVPACPGTDLFCLTPGSYDWNADWSTLPQELPSATPTSPVKNIAFEFDLSWNVGLPTDMEALLEEESPRSFFARTWVQYIGWGGGSSVWLIDRHARRSPINPKTNPRKFYDLHHEYISAYAHEILCDNDEEKKQTARFFWNHIDKLGSETTANGSLQSFFQHHFLIVRCSLRILTCRKFSDPEFPEMEADEEEGAKMYDTPTVNDPWATGIGL